MLGGEGGSKPAAPALSAAEYGGKTRIRVAASACCLRAAAAAAAAH